MNKVDTFLFQFNYFDLDKIDKLNLSPKKIIRLICFWIGLSTFALLCSFYYINSNFMVFIFTFITALWVLISEPIRVYSIYLLCERLIVGIEIANDELHLQIYEQQNKVIIKNYKLIEGWKPYFYSFNSFLYKLRNYEKHGLFQLDEVRFYSIKDLDTGMIYLFGLDKNRYFEYLEKGHRSNS